MDMYGMSSSDFSGVDELLDFSNDHDHDDQFATTDHTFHHNHNISSSSSTTTNTMSYHLNYDNNNNNNNNDNHHHMPTNFHHSTDFTDDLCVPSDDVAELEWLSNFVHDSFSNFPANNVAGTINYRPETGSFHSRSRTKRTRAPTNNTTWTTTTTTLTTPSPTILEKTMKLVTYSHANNSDNSSEAGIIRRCTHCASEKTPQWRTGPLGPKTLCNACGVRFKSGRLVPEYRPAASPTFVLTQHSNSHRKVMELRRQKEMTVVGHGHGHGQPQQSTSTEYQMYHHRQHSRSNYEVC